MNKLTLRELKSQCIERQARVGFNQLAKRLHQRNGFVSSIDALAVLMGGTSVQEEPTIITYLEKQLQLVGKDYNNFKRFKEVKWWKQYLYVLNNYSTLYKRLLLEQFVPPKITHPRTILSVSLKEYLSQLSPSDKQHAISVSTKLQQELKEDYTGMMCYICVIGLYKKPMHEWSIIGDTSAIDEQIATVDAEIKRNLRMKGRRWRRSKEAEKMYDDLYDLIDKHGSFPRRPEPLYGAMMQGIVNTILTVKIRNHDDHSLPSPVPLLLKKVKEFCKDIGARTLFVAPLGSMVKNVVRSGFESISVDSTPQLYAGCDDYPQGTGGSIPDKFYVVSVDKMLV